ncbi:S-adenosyl-L-methionine-dependent methyltransferase [Mycena galericulata]|nr:S-adenosyl-L-methionine-dependent methyltransferase [Mycena galericulata]
MSTNISENTTTTVAEKIASLSDGPKSSDTQGQYRLDLVAQWPIAPGSRVLELGCGQGDTTVALAEAVGDAGHVDAVDPAPLDYGSPQTLGEAQSSITAGPLGPRITWVQAEPLAFLAAHPTARWDAIVLAHSLWYFATPALIADTLRALSAHTKRICVAEWSLECTPGSSALTHVLAVLAQGALECRKPASESNVRTVVSPAAIKRIAGSAGLVLLREARVLPGEGVHDGRWETHHAVRPQFSEEVEEFVTDEREKGMVYAMRDAVEANLARVGGMTGVGTMDGWAAIFEPKE